LPKLSREGPFRFRELFAWGGTQNLRRMLLTISVQLGQQFTGSNMINYYTPTIFQSRISLSRDMSLILAGCAEVTYLVGSAILVFLVHRFGRRILLMVCSAGFCLCFVMVSILLSRGDHNLASGATAFIFLFQLFYGIGWLPVRSILSLSSFSEPTPCKPSMVAIVRRLRGTPDNSTVIQKCLAEERYMIEVCFNGSVLPLRVPS
jgi:MFS family permease